MMGKQGGVMRTLVFLLSLCLSPPLVVTPSSATTTQLHFTPRQLKDLDTARPFSSRKVHRTRDVETSESAADKAEHQAMATVSRSLLKVFKKHGRGPRPKVLSTSRDGFPLRPNTNASGSKVSSSKPSRSRIRTHGGPVMSSPIKVYLLWSGTVTSTQQAYIRTFVNALGQPSHTAGTAGALWAVNMLYYGPSKHKHVSSSISIGGESSTGTANTTSFGSSAYLPTDNVHTLVTTAVNNGALPNDPNGIYLVITGPDVLQKDQNCYHSGWYLFCEWNGQCDQYCGWHDYDDSMDLVYGWVGIPPASGCAGCNLQGNTPPSVPPGIDNPTASAVSVITHELEEAASDPQSNAWMNDLQENADRCAWFYGYGTLSPGVVPQYNIVVENNGAQWQYIIQYNWDRKKQTCALSA